MTIRNERPVTGRLVANGGGTVDTGPTGASSFFNVKDETFRTLLANLMDTSAAVRSGTTWPFAPTAVKSTRIGTPP